MSDSEDGKETKSTQTRYPYTNDGAALFLVAGSVALVALAATGNADMSTIPVEVRAAWIIGNTIAIAWLFGGGAVSAASKLVNGGR